MPSVCTIPVDFAIDRQLEFSRSSQLFALYNYDFKGMTFTIQLSLLVTEKVQEVDRSQPVQINKYNGRDMLRTGTPLGME